MLLLAVPCVAAVAVARACRPECLLLSPNWGAEQRAPHPAHAYAGARAGVRPPHAAGTYRCAGAVAVCNAALGATARQGDERQHPRGRACAAAAQLHREDSRRQGGAARQHRGQPRRLGRARPGRQHGAARRAAAGGRAGVRPWRAVALQSRPQPQERPQERQGRGRFKAQVGRIADEECLTLLLLLHACHKRTRREVANMPTGKQANMVWPLQWRWRWHVWTMSTRERQHTGWLAIEHVRRPAARHARAAVHWLAGR
eukprot:365945-Chlamydomonas_euryale.AAC.1